MKRIKWVNREAQFSSLTLLALKGTLLITLLQAGRPILDEIELRRKVGQVGDIKSIKVVEFRAEYVCDGI